MKKTLALFAALTLQFNAAFAAMNINHSYRVAGDAFVAPVQAFDDGASLYLQLRDASRPPAVFTPEGVAVSYTIRPPYMVLPLANKLVLKYGQRQASVESASPRPQGAASAVPPEKENVWYGAAIPSKVSGAAKEPVPAGAPSKVAANETPRPSKEIVATVENKLAEASGFFSVTFAAPAGEMLSGKSTDESKLILAVGEPMIAERRIALSRIALAGVTAVVGDGSIAGYQKAREVVAHIERVKGVRPRMESSGAPIGYVVVKGISQ